MKQIDWAYIRIPAIIFLVVSLVAVMLFVSANEYYDAIYRNFSTQEQMYTAVKRRFDEARRNRALYQQYLAEYKSLRERGVIGEEQRLSWIEELQNINKKYHLTGLRYEISPQKKASLPKITPPKNITINVSTMKLQAGLLHEGDIVGLWHDLQTNAKGMFAPDECEFESRFRRGQAVTYTQNSSYVKMQCELDWYSIMAKGS